MSNWSFLASIFCIPFHQVSINLWYLLFLLRRFIPQKGKATLTTLNPLPYPIQIEPRLAAPFRHMLYTLNIDGATSQTNHSLVSFPCAFFASISLMTNRSEE